MAGTTKQQSTLDLNSNPVTNGGAIDCGDIVSTGSVTADEFIGDGSSLTGVSGGSSEDAEAFAWFN